MNLFVKKTASESTAPNVPSVAVGPIASRLSTLTKPASLSNAEARLAELRAERRLIAEEESAVCRKLREEGNTSSTAAESFARKIADIDSRIGPVREKLLLERAWYQERIMSETREAVADHVSTLKEVLEGIGPDFTALTEFIRKSGVPIPDSVVRLHHGISDFRAMIGK